MFQQCFSKQDISDNKNNISITLIKLTRYTLTQMFTAKFYVDTKRKNALMLRITNNRKKAELYLGFQMTEDSLEDLLSANPKSHNMRMRSVILHWQSIIEDIKIDLAKEMRDNEDAKTIRDIVSIALFGNKETEDKNVCSGEFVTWFCKFADTHNTPEARTRKDGCIN